MAVSVPDTFSRLAHWGMVGFLVGVIVHSIRPYVPIPLLPLQISGMMCLSILFLAGSKKTLFILALCVLTFVLGLWRFEYDRLHHTLPGGLKAFNPDGFAYVINKTPYDASLLDPRVWLGDVRRELTRRTRFLLPADQAALLSGILYGEKNFSKQQKDIFRRAGLLHIVAVSGSNVTILVCLILPLLLALGCSRRGAFIGLSIGLILFVIFVSPSASVVRAACMGWLIQLAPMLGRLVRPSRLLLVAACCFVLWKPWALLFDVSFALSFLAMGGLLTWGKWLNEYLELKIGSKELTEIISSTLGATLTTIPYSAWAFGSFTVWGLFTNLLVLPVIPWTMFFGSIALFFYRVPWLELPVRGCLEWIIRVAQLVTYLPFGSITLSPTVWETMLAYIIIFAAFIFIQRQTRIIHKPSEKNAKKRAKSFLC